MSKCTDNKCESCGDCDDDSDEGSPNAEASINAVLVKRMRDPKRNDTVYIR